MRKKIPAVLLVLLLLLLPACSSESNRDLLNPDKPITVSIWHYYNGNIKEAFDQLVTEFNETVGMEQGIVVDAQSQGDVNQLATAVFDAANESIGSSPMPDIFASYPDNAFRVHEIVDIVNLNEYFSEEELSEYRNEFLEEGRFLGDQCCYIVPIAKSTENLFLNQTYWAPFARQHGFTEANLSTWEGIYEVAKAYYEETGCGFFSLDANANYMLVSGMQLGNELFHYNADGTVSFHLAPETAKVIWDYFYTPYINGYYVKTGRFSSDDAKTGTVLSYTGSTAGAAYFPTTITIKEGEEHQIEPLVLPYPHFKNGACIAIQQGAGMCVVKSDEAHEYAASLFLKWFTDTTQNLKFAVSTGYFPVKSEALNKSVMLEEANRDNVASAAILESIQATDVMLQQYTLYNSKPFPGSYDIRVLLDTQLMNKITADLGALNEAVQQGGDRSALISQLISEESFELWYAELQKEAELILTQS